MIHTTTTPVAVFCSDSGDPLFCSNLACPPPDPGAQYICPHCGGQLMSVYDTVLYDWLEHFSQLNNDYSGFDS